MRRALALATAILLVLDISSGAAQPIKPVEEKRVTEALNYLQASGIANELSEYSELLIPIIVTAFRSQHPGYSEACWTQLGTGLKEMMASDSIGMLDSTAKSYARHFSDQELMELGAFQRSDLGKKYKRATFELIRDGAQAPGAAQPFVEGVTNLVQNGGSSVGPDPMEAILPAMGKYLSDDESAKVRSFYGSGVGKKSLQLSHVIAKETVEARMERLEPKIATLSQKIRDNGVCS